MDIPAGIAANAALTRQAIGLEVIKQSSDRDKQLANILEQAIDNVPGPTRGRTVNITV